MKKHQVNVEIDTNTYTLVTAAAKLAGMSIEVYTVRLLEIAASEFRDIQGLLEADDEEP